MSTIAKSIIFMSVDFYISPLIFLY